MNILNVKKKRTRNYKNPGTSDSTSVISRIQRVIIDRSVSMSSTTLQKKKKRDVRVEFYGPDRVRGILSLMVVHELNWRGNICRVERKLGGSIDKSLAAISWIS